MVRTQARPISAAVVFVALLLGSPLAFGQATNPKVYVADFAAYNDQLETRLSDQMGRVVRDRIDSDPTVTIAPKLSTGGAVTTGGGALGNPAIIEANRLFESGRGQFVDQRYDEAAASLEKALGFFEANVKDISDFTTVEKTLYRLAASYHLSGATDKSKGALNRLLAFNPDYELDAGQDLPEDFVSLFDTVKAEKAASKGNLTTEDQAAGSQIWVDGSLRGVTPMVIKDLPAGTHFVQLKSDGGNSGGMVTIEPGTPATLTAASAGAGVNPEEVLVETLGDGQVGDDVRFAARDLASSSATAWVISAVVLPVDDEYVAVPFIYETETGTLRQLEPTRFDRDLLNINVDGYKMAQALIAAVFSTSAGTVVSAQVTLKPADFEEKKVAAAATPTPTAPSDSVVPTPTPVPVKEDESGEQSVITGIDTEDEWYENPWVWVGVGAGVAAITLTTVLLVVLPEDEEVTGFNATIEW